MIPKIGALTIGDELLNGEMADTNTARIGKILSAHGFFLRDSVTVGDVEADIEEALLDLSRKRDVVIVTGGLGPTGDDLTARVAARVFKRRLTQNEEALEQIKSHFLRLGRTMHPRNEKQALMPQKATVLPNPTGTAPGFLLHQSGKDFFFLPGVPSEMVLILEQSVLPRLLDRGGAQPSGEKVLKVFGLSEPKTEERLATVSLPEGILTAFGVEFPFVHVKLRASNEKSIASLEGAEAAARRALGDFVFAAGDETLPEVVARLLTGSGRTLALAESCTGGLISKMLTDVPGASGFLDRGAVTYADRAKREWLDVPEDLLKRHGAVSEACARAMAEGIRRSAGVDLGVAVTGIAGPGGGTSQKPVGTVFIALAAAGEVKARGYRFSGDRAQVRLMSACMALDWLRRHLSAQSEGKIFDRLRGSEREP